MVATSRSDVAQIKTSENSFLPQGVLDMLNERERIELFKYLISL
jgi:hypothetical protein